MAINKIDLFGEPNNIKASASFLKNGADGGGVAIFGYDKFIASLTYSKTGQSVAPTEIVGDNGSIIMETAVYYQDAYLVKQGKKTPLFYNLSKETLMGYEASAFYDFINGKRLDEYEQNSKITESVHACMDKIKKDAEKTDEAQKIKAIESQIKTINGQLSRFMDLYGLGTYTIEELDQKTKPLAEQKRKLQKELDKLKADSTTMTESEVLKLVESFDEALESGDLHDRRSIIEALINRIDIDGDDLTIHWNFV